MTLSYKLHRLHNLGRDAILYLRMQGVKLYTLCLPNNQTLQYRWDLFVWPSPDFVQPYLYKTQFIRALLYITQRH